MKLLRAGAIYAAANVASAAVPFLLLPLLTRLLTPADYAQIVAFALLVTFCMPFAGFSVHSAVGVAWFNMPRDEIPTYNGTALALIAGTTFLAVLVIVLIASVLPLLVSGLPVFWAGVAALTAGANVALQCRLVLWQSQGQPSRNAILQVVASVLSVGLSLIAVLMLGWGGSGRNAGIAVSALAMAAVALAILMVSGDAVWAIRREYLLAQIRYGMPLIPHVLAGAILATADRWAVSVLLGTEALGIYGAGAQLGMVMSILADAFVKAYNPWLYARLGSADPNDRLRVVGTVYSAVPGFLCIAIAVGLALYWTSGIFLGPRYSDAAGVLPWFMLGGAFSGIYYCTSSIYFFRGSTSLLAASTTSAAIVGGTAVWLLVSVLGVQGAAIGYALTQGLLALFSTITAFRSFDLPWLEVRRSVSILWQSARYPSPLNLPSP